MFRECGAMAYSNVFRRSSDFANPWQSFNASRRQRSQSAAVGRSPQKYAHVSTLASSSSSSRHKNNQTNLNKPRNKGKETKKDDPRNSNSTKREQKAAKKKVNAKQQNSSKHTKAHNHHSKVDSHHRASQGKQEHEYTNVNHTRHEWRVPRTHQNLKRPTPTPKPKPHHYNNSPMTRMSSNFGSRASFNITALNARRRSMSYHPPVTQVCMCIRLIFSNRVFCICLCVMCKHLKYRICLHHREEERDRMGGVNAI